MSYYYKSSNITFEHWTHLPTIKVYNKINQVRVKGQIQIVDGQTSEDMQV